MIHVVTLYDKISNKFYNVYEIIQFISIKISELVLCEVNKKYTFLSSVSLEKKDDSKKFKICYAHLQC